MTSPKPLTVLALEEYLSLIRDKGQFITIDTNQGPLAIIDVQLKTQTGVLLIPVKDVNV